MKKLVALLLTSLLAVSCPALGEDKKPAPPKRPKVDLQDINVTKTMDSSSPSLAKKKGTEKPVKPLIIKMQDPNISTYRRSPQPAKGNIGATTSSSVRR